MSGNAPIRDLLITAHTPALGSGRGLRTYGITRALASHRPLDVLYVAFGAPAPDQAFLHIEGASFHRVEPSRGRARLQAYLRALLSGVPSDYARAVSPELIAAASAMAAESGRGRVIADGPTAAAALLRLSKARPVIYNAHNLESAFRHELHDRDDDRAGIVRRLRALVRRSMLSCFERRILSSFSESWMVSAADIAGARQLCRKARLRYVPNVVDVEAIEAARARVGAGAHMRSRSSPDSGQTGTLGANLVFVANFAYGPNRSALRFLLEQVMPRVWSALPSTRLTLVGGGLAQPPNDDERICAAGFVEDLGKLYAAADCAVVPLLQGGGSPLKLLEALAFGVAVVATPKAVAGLEVTDGVHCLVAGEAAEFARAIETVLSGGAPALGQQGHELVERSYSVEALSRMLDPATGGGTRELPSQPASTDVLADRRGAPL